MARIVSSSTIRPIRTSRATSLPVENHRQVQALTQELATKIMRSAFPTAQARTNLVRQLVFATLGADPYPTAVRDGFNQCIHQIVQQEVEQLYSVPELPPSEDVLAMHELRSQIRLNIDYLDNEAELLVTWRDQLQNLLQQIAQAFPQRRPDAGTLTISVPLFTLFPDPAGTIDEIVRKGAKLATITGDPTIRPGTRLGDALVANLLATSRLTHEEAQNRPYRIVWPNAAKLSPPELLERICTPLPC